MNNFSLAQIEKKSTSSFSDAPKEMQDLAQWLVWKYEQQPGKPKPTKVPYQARVPSHKASSMNTKHFASFEQATATMDAHGFDGIGYTFTKSDPNVGIDFDNCVTDGRIDPDVMGWLESFDSYAEYSVSGNGIHIIIKGKLSGSGRKVGNFEIYDTGRYFAMTGDHVPGTPTTVTEAQGTLDLFVAHLDSVKPRKPTTAPATRPTAQPVNLADSELLQRMFAGKDGAALQALWNGEWLPWNIAHGVKEGQGHSEADMRLAGALAFWTGGDHDRIERLMMASGLACDKYTRKLGNYTYLQTTIYKAVRNCTAFYNPAQGDEVTKVLRALRQFVTGYRFTGRNADSMQRCSLAVLQMFEAAHSTETQISVRHLADLAGVSSRTAERCLLGVMNSETGTRTGDGLNGWIINRTSTGNGIHANTYAVNTQGLCSKVTTQESIETLLLWQGDCNNEQESSVTSSFCVVTSLHRSVSVLEQNMRNDAFRRGTAAAYAAKPEQEHVTGSNRLEALRNLFQREVVANRAAKSFSTVGLRIIDELLKSGGLSINELAERLGKDRNIIGATVKRMTTGIALYNCEPIVIVSETVTGKGKSKVITLPDDWYQRVTAATPYLATDGATAKQQRNHASERLARAKAIKAMSKNSETIAQADKVIRGAERAIAYIDSDFRKLDQLRTGSEQASVLIEMESETVEVYL